VIEPIAPDRRAALETMSEMNITPDPAAADSSSRRPPRPQLGGPPVPVAVPTTAGAVEVVAPPAGAPPPPSPGADTEPRRRAGVTVDARVLGVVAAGLVLVVALVAGLLLAQRGADDPSTVAAPTHARAAAPAVATPTVPTETAPAEPSADADADASRAADADAGALAPAITTSTYTLSPPAGWVRDAREKDHGGYVESRWHLPGSPGVFVLVDHTVGFDGTAVEGARSVRALTRRSPGYREFAFAPTVLAGATAWRWAFALGGVRKVDWFLTGCGTGYALLGAAPADRWSTYFHLFADVARSLEPTC
jgi:hypothetical protein